MVKPVPQEVPAILLKPTPAPKAPHEDTVTDQELGVFMQAQRKAIQACNDDKLDIQKIVKTGL